MLDKVNIHKRVEDYGDIYVGYNDTDSFYNFRWWGRNIDLLFNPNAAYNKIIGVGVGNFFLIDHENFVIIWKEIIKHLKHKILVKYPRKNHDAIYEEIDKLYDGNLTILHVCDNVKCNYPAYTYVNEIFANLRLNQLATNHIKQKTLVKYENGSVCFSVYDKVRQFKYFYKTSLEDIGVKGHWLRLEIQTKTNVVIDNYWDVSKFSDLLDKDTFNSLKEKYVYYVKNRVFDYKPENKKIIIPNKKVRNYLIKNPIIEFIRSLDIF